MAEEAKHLIELDQATFKLGEKVYTIYAAGLEKSSEWRVSLQEEVTNILNLVSESGDQFKDVDLRNVKWSEMDIIELIPTIVTVFTRLNISMTVAGNLLVSYSDQLEADRDYIMKYASTKQVVFALWELVKLEYPFGGLISEINRNGPAVDTILKN